MSYFELHSDPVHHEVTPESAVPVPEPAPEVPKSTRELTNEQRNVIYGFLLSETRYSGNSAFERVALVQTWARTYGVHHIVLVPTSTLRLIFVALKF